MQVPGRRRAIIFFLVFGICLTTFAVALNVGWILLNLRQIALLVLGIVFFAAIITGLVLNTIFLIREIRRNERHDAFINSVTHELKTPIASIRLYLETLRLRDVDQAQREHFYEIMLSDTTRLMHTVEQVLQAGRTGDKRRHIILAPVDIDELLRESIEIVRQRYRLDDTALHYDDSPSKLLKVKGDFQELQTAITNLLDNAVKYSPETVSVRVVTAEVKPNHVAVHIKDTGIGISNDQLKQIFRRFYRVPEQIVQRIKGTGLGLYIVRAIIEKHGGQITAESQGAGKGSTFTVKLPKF